MKDPILFDFEINSRLSAIVRISNGDVSREISVTVNLKDVDERMNDMEDFNIWTGAKMVFTKDNESDPTEAANQDRLTDNVWITRGNEGGQIFNIKKENTASKSDSPIDTEWSLGTTDQIKDLTFKPFREAVCEPKDVVGKNLVLHLITDDIYIDVKFTSWPPGKVGGFSYERSTM